MRRAKEEPLNMQEAKDAAQNVVAPWEALAALNDKIVAQRPALLRRLKGKQIDHEGVRYKLVSFQGGSACIQDARGKQRVVDLHTLDKEQIANVLHG